MTLTKIKLKSTSNKRNRLSEFKVEGKAQEQPNYMSLQGKYNNTSTKTEDLSKQDYKLGSSNSQVVDIEEKIRTEVSSLGYVIVILNILGSNVIQIFIEKEDYESVSIDDCSYVSQKLRLLFEGSSQLMDKYGLEVSSCGINRPLISKKDYEHFIGEVVELVVYEKIDGKRRLKGLLSGVKDNKIVMVTIESGVKAGTSSSCQSGDKILIDLDQIRKSKLVREI